MRSPRFALAILIAAGVATASCATYEPSDQPYQKGAAYRDADIAPAVHPALDTDEAGLWMTMEEAEHDLKTAGNLVRDEALNAYVKGVTCKVAGPYCADIRVYILRVPDFNAMMAPNGALVVWTGLLLRTRNEAQLATILGHEIGHYIERHSVERWRDIRTKTDILMFFSIATSAAGVGYVGNLASIGVLASIYAYSRDNEREADDVGLKIMADAGYDPREAPKVWARLIREEEADEDKKSRIVFFATHPVPEERLDTLKAEAERLASTGFQGGIGVDAYDAAVLPLRAAFLRDELDLRRFSRTEALLNMLIEDGANVGELQFYRGELYRLRNGDGDLDRAMEAYREAENSDGPPPELFRSIALIHMKKGESVEAREAFSRYLALKPDAEDREMIRLMMEPAG
jgi:beta-barrel assembly-enhancing protease